MGEVQVQIHHQEQQQQQPFINSTPPKPTQQQPEPTELLQLRDSVQPIDLSMLHLNAAATAAGLGCQHYHHPNQPCALACGGSSGSNSMKRRSPATSSGSGYGERSAKKLSCDKEDLILRGFSAISLPISLGALAGNDTRSGGRPFRPVLRRCVSDPSKPPAPAGEFPEGVVCGTPAAARGSGLPPLPPSLRRSVSDVTPSPPKVLSRSLSSEEATPDSSMRRRRMKDRLREIKQWCDEFLEDEDEEEKEEEDQEIYEGAVAEDDKVLPQDKLEGDSEEAVSVEWVDKCLSLIFRCPCGKGYEVLLSEKSCYYKLV